MAAPIGRTEEQCDEGGVHEFRMPEPSKGGLWRCICCPCWAIFTCAASEGAAAVSPLGTFGKGDDPDEPTCTKCGLNPSEASALAQAKEAEAHGMRTSKGPGYFTQQGMAVNAD